MKVLERHEVNEKTFPMIITCNRVVDEYGFAYGDEKDFCGSKLEIEAEDIKKHSWTKYPDYSGIDYGVKCPVCGQFIVIDKRKLPAEIIKIAPETLVSQ